MYGVIGSIDDFIGQRTDGLHRPALSSNRIKQTFTAIGWMWSPGFAETARQDFIRSFKEYYRNLQAALAQDAQLLGKIRKESSFAKTNNQRRAINSAQLVF